MDSVNTNSPIKIYMADKETKIIFSYIFKKISELFI